VGVGSLAALVLYRYFVYKKKAGETLSDFQRYFYSLFYRATFGRLDIHGKGSRSIITIISSSTTTAAGGSVVVVVVVVVVSSIRRHCG